MECCHSKPSSQYPTIVISEPFLYLFCSCNSKKESRNKVSKSGREKGKRRKGRTKRTLFVFCPSDNSSSKQQALRHSGRNKPFLLQGFRGRFQELRMADALLSWLQLPFFRFREKLLLLAAFAASSPKNFFPNAFATLAPLFLERSKEKKNRDNRTFERVSSLHPFLESSPLSPVLSRVERKGTKACTDVRSKKKIKKCR
ncbi:hypothetical protein L873DRAFT_117791 [Choiromyces venosus 120613-1]|uniref:Uncharacterized protein n=1 Tax=Choiromyces venosus 120613-1 TaxID=1336337 RepID=A0A3N4J484_9PEZI|nr:hypothetical protein L873DRAFT_117791 [Choiromyces venosus 120613-1]